MAGDTKANQANTNNRQGVQLSRSTARDAGALKAAKKMKGPARKRMEANLRAKRQADRALGR